MALVLLGIPWLASALGTIFVSIVTFLAAHLTRKIAVISAVIASLLALTVAFVVAIESLLSTAYASVPVGFSSAFILIPDNFSTCISIIISARLLLWVYRWNKSIIEKALAI